MKCATLEELPDYHGPSEEVDPLVEELLLRHNQRDPMGHGGGEMLPFKLASVPDKEWFDDQTRKKIIEKLNEGTKQSGFDGWVYESMNTYKEDAMKCYRRHRRPSQECIDWWSDDKRIGRPTKLGRDIVKDQYKLGERDPHLCQFCPVASYVQTQVNFRQGLYK